jgi:hypothetical protein
MSLNYARSIICHVQNWKTSSIIIMHGQLHIRPRNLRGRALGKSRFQQLATSVIRSSGRRCKLCTGPWSQPLCSPCRTGRGATPPRMHDHVNVVLLAIARHTSTTLQQHARPTTVLLLMELGTRTRSRKTNPQYKGKRREAFRRPTCGPLSTHNFVAKKRWSWC